MCANMYIYESEQGASKEREPAGGEEKTERESRLISLRDKNEQRSQLSTRM